MNIILFFQGDVQGPFTSAEMADWFDSGYFSSTLFIRRGCDFQFVMLGQMITLCGGYIPFLLPKNILSKVYDVSAFIDVKVTNKQIMQYFLKTFIK